MPKVHIEVINSLINQYLAKPRGVLHYVGNTVSTFTGSVNSQEIETQITDVKALLTQFATDNYRIVDLLKKLGSIGRLAQQNKFLANTASELRQVAYAACSYILYTLQAYPEENVQMLSTLANGISELESEREKLISQFNENDPDAIPIINKKLDIVICDLATLGKPKWLLLSQRIHDLYGNVEMPSSGVFKNVSKYNSALPLILNSQFYIHDYLLSECKTNLTSFILCSVPAESLKKTVTEDKALNPNDSSATSTKTVTSLLNSDPPSTSLAPQLAPQPTPSPAKQDSTSSTSSVVPTGVFGTPLSPASSKDDKKKGVVPKGDQASPANRAPA